MGTTAENVAKKYQLTRKDQQEFAISSHQKAYEAQQKGNFKDEITVINSCNKDGAIRPNTNQKILILSFNEETLKNKEILSKNDIKDIDYEESNTDSKGKKRNWIREFFTNLNPDPYGKRNQ